MASNAADMFFKSMVNTENPAKANAEQLEERITSLEVGSWLVFVKDISDKDDTRKWIGVQCCCAFGREFYIVARYHAGFCDIWDWDLSDEDLIDRITSLLWNRKKQKVDDVFVFEENKQDVEAYLFSDGSLHLTGYTNFGAEISLPPVICHDIFEATEIFYAEEDIKQRLVDTESAIAERVAFKDIHKMAQDVVSAKSNCDDITGRYWDIVDDVIKSFIWNS